MIDKKLTDEEIVSSLEVIATTRNCNECKIRNCKWGTCNCSQTTANAALNLISRQKAEIEKLKGSTIVNNIMERQKIEREAKVKAYKEFAKEVTEEVKKAYNDNLDVLQEYLEKYEEESDFELVAPIKAIIKGRMGTLLSVDDFINDLLKEMVGEEQEGKQ